MKKNRKAFLIGWHAYKNTGNNAMFQVISWLLNKHFNVEDITLLCTKNTLPKLYIKNIVLAPAFWFTDKLYFLKRIFFSKNVDKNDILVFGGGSIFHSDNSVKWKLDILREFKSKKPQKAAIAIGVSIGPFATKKGEELFIEFVNLIDLIIVRDKYSEEFMLKNGFMNKVLLSYDFAFYMPNILSYKHNVIKKTDTLNIGISIRYFSKDDLLNEKIVNLISKIEKLANKKIKLHFFAFAKEDEKLFKHINKKIENANFNNYHDNPIDFLEKMKICNSFVGMRLHSQIYSIILGIPIIVLNYHQKCFNFAQDVNIPTEQIYSLHDIDEDIFFNTLFKISHSDANNYLAKESIKLSFEKVNEKFKLLSKLIEDV